MSAVDTEEKEIDGLRVICTRIDVWSASFLMARLGDVAGEAIVKIGVAIATGARLEDFNVDEVAPQIGAAFGKVSRETHDFLVLQSLAGTEVVRDGVKYPCLGVDKIKAAFHGKPWALWKAIWFAWVVNFRGFSSGGSPTPNATAAA